MKHLNESNQNAQRLIYLLVNKVDIQQLHELYKQTLEVEANGGLMTPNGKRRTLGGVFFYLAKQNLPNDISQELFQNKLSPSLSQHLIKDLVILYKVSLP